MRSNYLKTLKTAAFAVAILLLGAGVCSAQSVTLTTQRTNTTLPDGQIVPMWGYSCTATTPAICTPGSTSLAWAPPVITVPTGSTLSITLINGLPVPTSLVIVGQLGGGLGTDPRAAPLRTDPSPDHSNLSSNRPTWPIAGAPTDPPSFAPPPQGSRVRSFATEVAAGALNSSLTWSVLKAGTYLIESGTHPSIQGPMGLYGVLVVTDAANSIAYPAIPAAPPVAAIPPVTYDADRVVLLSEIDPVQNNAVNQFLVTVAGCSTTTATCSGTVSPAAETRVWSGQTGGCGNPSSATYHTCYPPAVNFDPRYYLINGRSFDKTAPGASQLNVAATPAANGVLLRLVNAGLRMHVPAVVGLDMTLIAEDGNQLPGTPRVQSEVFMAAGKTYDVKVAPPSTTAGYAAGSFAIFDRQLSLSTNNSRDGGMIAHLLVNGGTAPAGAPVSANNATYYCNAGVTLTVSDPSKGVLANATGANGAVLGTVNLFNPTTDSLAFNSDGTFTYTQPSTNTTCGGSFNYLVNGTLPAMATITQCDAVNTGCAVLGGAPTAVADIFPASNVASTQHVSPPGVLANDTDPDKHPLTAVYDTGCIAPVTTPPSTLLSAAQAGLNADGSFTATPGAAGNYYFCYRAVNSQKTQSNVVSAQVTFPTASGLVVTLKDGKSGATLPNDYRWILEEDRTFQIDPATQVNNRPACTSPGVPAGCGPVPSLGTNFHTSSMPVVASGCVGTVACEAGQSVQGVASVCDIGNGGCRPGSQRAALDPSQVALDPTKHYYISVLPGDGADPFNGGDSGHTMGGAPISPAQITTTHAVTVFVEPTPLPTAKIAVFVFEDDSPLNGEIDVHGGTDVLGTSKEPGLGGFEITLFDDAGGPGDATGQMTYDMFNYPLSNSLQGMIDPLNGKDACPISKHVGVDANGLRGDGLVGMIVTCPAFEEDGVTPSPLVGQAVIANMMPGRYGVVATPAADRIGRGEEWLQTNTLDGQKAHDSFIKVGGPSYFQEFGPAGYHVAIGMANPKIISDRLPLLCPPNTTAACGGKLSGRITNLHYSRPPNENLYGSGSRDSLGFTQCYVSLGDPDGDDVAFAKCDGDGNFSFSGIPDGTWRLTIFDQWNDQIVDGLAKAVQLPHPTMGRNVTLGDIPVLQWHTNLYTKSFLDLNQNGIQEDIEPGLALVPTNIRFRDGSFSNFNNTDLLGAAGFNEVFPLFSWYVVESDATRYKPTGIHVVYDAGGPVDANGGGSSTIAANLANTVESTTAHLPTNLRVPGARYCASADCPGGLTGASFPPNAAGSTGRIDPGVLNGQIVNAAEGWQGFSGQNSFIEFGKAPFATGENGGIRGQVIYYSTRPFDDPSLDLQLSWTPGVPDVTLHLYREDTAPDGTTGLTLVDTTQSASWDKWAQGFRVPGTATTPGIPNMNCPGQESTDTFFYTLSSSRQWLNPSTPLPNNSQFKCYDGMHMFNQVQPAVYDGMYQFPSAAYVAAHQNQIPAGGTLVTLPAGKYVVEVVVPPGYELVKEEDKNILIGDNYIAPVTQQFGGLGSIFIMPDQAAVSSTYNPTNPLNPTTDLGAQPRHEGDTGSVETFWPCVGQARVVPDYISLFPQSTEVAPFAGATRRLCDRKEITLEDQMSALAKFYLFSPVHVAAHYTGFILDDFSSEFDPFSPQFGEKFAVPNVPVSIKNFDGVEVARTYSDQWGIYNGLNYSTWEVNPPNPTGYSPTMMVTCMNDPGPIVDTRTGSPTIGQMITDPLYNSNYSQFCYEIPFMPGQTQYMDTPVVPVSAFAEGYNPPDCAYPDATPAISEVDGTGVGPWLSAPGTITIHALGDQIVPNPGYNGPAATAAPYNQKFVTRHYGFGPAPAGGCSNGIPNAACPNVTVGGIPLHGVSWSDTTITGQVQGNVPLCSVQQRGTGNGGARCGELVITAVNGKKSIDTVTVTIGGKAPTRLAAGQTIQSAIDAALPGDLILVPPGTYNEMLLMWKPVRLQGVGAASVKVNANTHPSGKMDVWRRQVNCLFGLALNGALISGSNQFDATGTYSCSFPVGQAQVDPIPLEPLIGWDSNLNGNLAELLQEPTLMGAYEGAGITVLGKGLLNPNTPGVCDGLDAAGCIQLTIAQCSTSITSTNPNSRSNFLCNPSRIDGISFIDSSQGGGGIFLHGWNHNTEVSNNRVYANAGTLTGGITVGQVEVPDGTISGDGFTQLAFGFNNNVNVHNNAITQNASFGDEINSTTPSSAGGVTFCSGADNYHFNYNWVCGNMSSGDGGGVAHFGFSYNGDISHNSVVFNQSNNPTLPTYGGGIVAQGVPPDGTFCENATIDQDCAPELSDGVGPGLVIDGNLIIGNTAESGKGGGLRLQLVNGTDVQRSPNNPNRWHSVSVFNNIIANNVAGWSGGGVSFQDALRVNFINNTVVSNDVTASSGVLFNTDLAKKGNIPPPQCTNPPNPNVPDPICTGTPITTSTYQPAGLETARNTPNLEAAQTNVNCFVATPPSACFSNPVLRNDLFWQNRSFFISVGGTGAGIQQNVVTLNPTLNQAGHPTGYCAPGAVYWDLGAFGDTGSTNHSSGFTLNPTFSILTNLTGTGYNTTNNRAPASPGVASQYCNGSRVPAESAGNPASGAFAGFAVPPGISDTVLPNPLFFLQPSATPDEGNQWINMNYGPLSLSNPSIASGSTGYGVPLGDYSITGSSDAINHATATGAPNHDFFGTTRPQGGAFDIGAVEFAGTITPPPPPPLPALGVLDNFNRANANTLNNGTNWSQVVMGGAAAIRVNDVTPANITTGTALCINVNLLINCTLDGAAYWNTTTFGNRQAAAFTFATAPATGDALVLKVTGGGATIPANFVRVLYSTATAGSITVGTTTNGGLSYTTAAALTGFANFAIGDTMTAMVDQSGTAYVWKTTAANVTTLIGSATLPANTLWTTGGGRIGMHLPANARVDNFSGANVP